MKQGRNSQPGIWSGAIRVSTASDALHGAPTRGLGLFLALAPALRVVLGAIEGSPGRLLRFSFTGNSIHSRLLPPSPPRRCIRRHSANSSHFDQADCRLSTAPTDNDPASEPPGQAYTRHGFPHSQRFLFALSCCPSPPSSAIVRPFRSRPVEMDGSLGFPERPWERPWERWTPRGNAQYSSTASRQSEITLEVSMRDIILNSKESMSVNPRWSFDSTRTQTREESPESNHGGEKGTHPGPPPPVGFWDLRLRKTRVEICKAWLKTSE